MGFARGMSPPREPVWSPHRLARWRRTAPASGNRPRRRRIDRIRPSRFSSHQWPRPSQAHPRVSARLRLFLVLEFAGREAVHDSRAGQPGAYRRVLESFRAAKLSGFLVCAHITIGPDSDACEIGELFEELCAKDADGLIVSSGGTNSAASTSGNLGEIRGLIRHGGWERFSRILESSPVAPAAVPARPRISGKQEGAFEEGV